MAPSPKDIMNTVNSTSRIKAGPTEKLKKIMEQEKKPVTGVFRYHECPGGSVTFAVKKFPGDPVLKYVMQDGEEYTVPLWVARHLNGYDGCAQALNGKTHSCGYAIHENTVDKLTGKPLITVGQVRRRMGFESTTFMTPTMS